MNPDDLDELTPREIVNGKFPRLLDDDASSQEMIRAINGLAVELQLIRLAVADHGTRIESFCMRIERAFGKRPTDPAPPKAP